MDNDKIIRIGQAITKRVEEAKQKRNTLVLVGKDHWVVRSIRKNQLLLEQ